MSRVEKRNREVNLLEKISDDVMLEHVIPHLSIRTIGLELTRVNKEIHELTNSNLFWHLQIIQKLRAVSVIALAHLLKGLRSHEIFKKLFCLHHVINRAIQWPCSNLILLDFMNIAGGGLKDVPLIELLIKRSFFNEYRYYSKIDVNGSLRQPNGFCDENGAYFYFSPPHHPIFGKRK